MILRLSGAGAIVSAGLSLAWPFRAASDPVASPSKAEAVAALTPIPRPEAAQVVFQSPGQTAPSVKVVQSPKRLPRTAPAEPPAPRALPVATLSAEPPELPSHFTAIERAGNLAGKPVASTESGGTSAQIPVREHCLVDGDTLQRLAQRYLGDGHRWPEIQSANASLLTNPEVLPIGKTIRLPPRTAALGVANASRDVLKPLPLRPITEPGVASDSP
jgi:nucleoid-associated protein YgaU